MDVQTGSIAGELDWDTQAIVVRSLFSASALDRRNPLTTIEIIELASTACAGDFLHVAA
jgi:hypothetical protein